MRLRLLRPTCESTHSCQQHSCCKLTLMTVSRINILQAAPVHSRIFTDERLPKRVLFGHMDGSGVRGKSQKQWVDYVREDLQFAGLSFTWWRKSQDRACWRAAIECLLQRT